MKILSRKAKNEQEDCVRIEAHFVVTLEWIILGPCAVNVVRGLSSTFESQYA